MTNDPNDPARSGSPLPAGKGDVTLSCNEIEVLCFKAARGAGMSWGLAEETGYAAGWLASHGIPWPSAMLSILENFNGADWREIRPVRTSGNWQAHGENGLCPIALGAALSDFAGLDDGGAGGGAIIAGPVGQPVAALPFLSAMAARLDKSVAAAWDRGQVVLGPEGSVSGEPEALADLDSTTLQISTEDGQVEPGHGVANFNIDRATLVRLNALAMRTTVPASEQSRADAGASTGDND